VRLDTRECGCLGQQTAYRGRPCVRLYSTVRLVRTRGFSRAVVAAFDAGRVTSDAGAVAARADDRRLGFPPALPDASPTLDSSGVCTLRGADSPAVFSIPLGIRSRRGAAAARRSGDRAGRSRRSARRGSARLAADALSPGETADGRELLAMGDELLRSAVARLARAERHPRRVVIDIDPTVDPAQGGEQQGCSSTGFTTRHCYLPVARVPLGGGTARPPPVPRPATTGKRHGPGARRAGLCGR